jgi:hypothetical protein
MPMLFIVLRSREYWKLRSSAPQSRWPFGSFNNSPQVCRHGSGIVYAGLLNPCRSSFGNDPRSNDLLFVEFGCRDQPPDSYSGILVAGDMNSTARPGSPRSGFTRAHNCVGKNNRARVQPSKSKVNNRSIVLLSGLCVSAAICRVESRA